MKQTGMRDDWFRVSCENAGAVELHLEVSVELLLGFLLLGIAVYFLSRK
jgi:hypothetical protein